MKYFLIILLIISFNLNAAFVKPNKSNMIFQKNTFKGEVKLPENSHQFEKYSTSTGDFTRSKYEYEDED